MWFSMGSNLGFIRPRMSAVNKFWGVKNAIYKKYTNYDHALSDFNESCRAVTAPLICYNFILLPHTLILMVRVVLGRMWPLSLSFNCGIWPMVEAVHV
jgi:hypothetical protein